MKKKLRNILFFVVLVCLIIFGSYKTYEYIKSSKEDSIKEEQKNYQSSSNENLHNDNNSSNEQNVNDEVEEDYEKIIELTLSELEQKLLEEEQFPLIVTQTFCGHCTRFKPVLNKFLKENDLFIYEINYQNLTSEEKDKFKETINVSGTPTIVFIKEGKEIDSSKRVVGEAGSTELKEKFTEFGYLY